MKSSLSILFAILLTDLAHAGLSTSGLYHHSKFDIFLNRLEKSIKEAPNTLPFVLQINVIEDLKKTSKEFKDSCVSCDLDLQKTTDNYVPVIALNRSINNVFHNYKDKAEEIQDKLEVIQKNDPIGLIVYLTKKSVKDYSSSKFIESVEEFWDVMHDRICLFASRTDDIYPKYFRDDKDKILYSIRSTVREDITNEWMPFSLKTVNSFCKLAMKQFPGITMYPIDYSKTVEKFQPHKSSQIDDVQILVGIFGPSERAHAICIYYQASSQNVLIYDSLDPMIYNKNLLDSTQKITIDILYPFKKDIIFVEPKTYQTESPSCAIFAIMYATMLLLKEDPGITKIKLNHVHGDDTLYMRLHILKMFAERNLTLMDGMKKN